MPIKGYDVEIAGQGFNLAEDAEGQHFDEAGEPLRPPNAVTVQGEQRNRFQVRPDTLLWTLTDWSGGEGQIKYNFREPHRWRELTGVRVFGKPGTLRPGFATEDTKDNGGSSALAKSLALVKAKGNLYGLDMNTNEVYTWSSTKWGAAATLTGPSAGANPYADGDSDNVYWIEASTNNVWKWDGTTATKISDTLIAATATSQVVQNGAYVYVYEPTSATVWEIAKSGASESAIDEWTEEGVGLRSNSAISVFNGKIYIMVVHSDMTIIREITPTTAAGTGFGAEIARLPGFRGEGLWTHSGLLYMVGDFGSGEEGTIMYFDPQQLTYGTLGRLREADQGTKGVHDQFSGALDTFWAYEDLLPGTIARPGIYQIDIVSGGMAIVAQEGDQSNLAGQAIGSVAAHQGDLFVSGGKDISGKFIIRAIKDSYTSGDDGGGNSTSYAISPWHDMDLAGEKILSSVVLSCEALPADWTIHVDYAINGSDTWTTIVGYTTDSGTGVTTQISTDSSTVKFHTLAIRIRFEYTGAGTPSTAPVVLGIDVLAQVAKIQPVHRLILDLDDAKSRTPDGLSGAKKWDALKTAAIAENVVAYIDGYSDRNSTTEVDVVIDGYRKIASTPGEAIGLVTLREVI